MWVLGIVLSLWIGGHEMDQRTWVLCCPLGGGKNTQGPFQVPPEVETEAGPTFVDSRRVK